MSTALIRRERRSRAITVIAAPLTSILIGAATAQDTGRNGTAGEAARATIEPKDVADWRISINLGPWGPERQHVGWHEIAIDDSGRCRVAKVRGGKETILFDEKLSPQESATILQLTFAAVSSGPPERMHGYWEDGHRIVVTLATAKRQFEFRVSGLSELLEDAGLDVQKLVAVVNRRLRSGRIWTEEQETLALMTTVDPKDLTEWRLAIDLGPGGPSREELGWFEISVDHEGRCRVVKIRRDKRSLLVDVKLSADDLRTVLERACAAVSNRPPKGMPGAGEDGQRIVVRLTTPKKTFEFARAGLSPLLENAGPAIQRLIQAINGHLPATDRIWTKQQEKEVRSAGADLP